MTEKRFTVKIAVHNSKAASGIKEAVSLVPGFSLCGAGSANCDLVVLEVGRDLDEEFQTVDQIRAKGSAREIFLTSSRNDPDVLLRVLKTGVKEFFPQPVNKEEVITALEKFKQSAAANLAEQVEEKKGMLMCVIGSKGGAGASTTAVNLAVALKQTAETSSVALMDMKPFLGSVDLFMDIRTSFNWLTAVEDIERMDSTYLLNTLYKHQSGIQVLTAPAKPSALAPLDPETTERLVNAMRSAFDIVVVDCQSSFDEPALRMLAFSDTIVVVSELNVPSIINTKKILDTLEGLGLSRGKDIKVIVNRYQKKEMISLEQAEKTIGKRISAILPNDYEAAISAINAGKTFFDEEIRSPLTEKFKELAALLINKETAEKKKSLFPSALANSWKTLTDAAHKSGFVENFRIRAGLVPRREAIKKEKSV